MKKFLELGIGIAAIAAVLIGLFCMFAESFETSKTVEYTPIYMEYKDHGYSSNTWYPSKILELENGKFIHARTNSIQGYDIVRMVRKHRKPLWYTDRIDTTYFRTDYEVFMRYVDQ